MTRLPDDYAAVVQRFADELHSIYRVSRFRTVQNLAEGIPCSRSTLTAYLNADRLPPERDFVYRFTSACVPEPAERDAAAGLLAEIWEEAQTTRRTRGRTKTNQGEALLPFSKASVPRTLYRNNEEFYGAAAEYARNAHSVIRLTYVRQVPPSALTSDASGKYFEEVLNWARTPGPRSVSRIVGIPEIDGKLDKQMVGWATEQAELMSSVPNYEVRAMKWFGRGDNLNMALFDDDTVFFAVSGIINRQQLSGCSITDHDIHQLMSLHFDQLWGSLPSFAEFLSATT